LNQKWFRISVRSFGKYSCAFSQTIRIEYEEGGERFG
jgi:hypothetical protein